MLAIRLSPEIEDRLTELAKCTGRTKTFYVREAILQYLEDMEDIYTTEQRVRKIRSGKTKTIPIDKVMKKYDLED
jgi:RHH-type rel operon transcriptional repressor/antitoxin RelB